MEKVKVTTFAAGAGSFRRRGSGRTADASCKSAKIVDYVEVEAADYLKASEGCKGRDKLGSDLYRANQRIL